MSPVHLTSLLVNSELRANRVGPRGMALVSAVPVSGDLVTTAESTPSLTHRYSMPVVRELPPRQIRSAATW